MTGEGLWLDWLVSMAVHDTPDAPERYRWNGPELGPVTATAIDNVPATFETTVEQYAADYYELPDRASFQIDFAGAPTVSLLGVDAPSGDTLWAAQRANDSNPRQPRSVLDPDKLTELAASIKLHGLIQPLIVTETVEGFVLIAGERRWRASRLAGLEEVPVVVKETAPCLLYTSRCV